MHQQVPNPIDQYGVQPQMAQPLVICPLQFVYNGQLVSSQTAVSEEVQQRPVLFNVQNPPPWIQNRQQNVIYVQQMPNQILPYVQHNMVQNQVYTPQFNYQMPQQVVSQEMITPRPVLEIPPIIQPKTENNVGHVSSTRAPLKMPILTQLLNQKPIEIAQEKPVMQSQHVQTDFPFKTKKKNVAVNNSKQTATITKEVDGPQPDPTKIKLDAPTDKMDVKEKRPGAGINKDIPPLVKSIIPGRITTKTIPPLLRPIVTPSEVKNNMNPIPIKLRALDPTQVISIPNYGTLTNYTVLNEDKDVRIPSQIQNISTIPTMNAGKIITAKLNEKNEITFEQNVPTSENKYFSGTAGRIMPNSIKKAFSNGTNTLVSKDTRKEPNETPTLVSNETQTAGKIVANSIAKAFSTDSSMPESHITSTSNDVHETVPNARIDLNEITGSFKIETIKTVATETPKLITIDTLKPVKIDTPIPMMIDPPKKIPNDAPRPVSIKPETIKSIKVKKISQKAVKNTDAKIDQPLVKTVAKAKKVEVKPKTMKEIKKNIANKTAANEKSKTNDVYILTHVIDGHVIQESNVAFPIYLPTKEKYSYEPFHEVPRQERTEEISLPSKQLQTDANAKTIETPALVSITPNQPDTTDPAEVVTDTHEVREMTNETREVTAVTSSLTKVKSISNNTREDAAMPIDSTEVEAMPKEKRPKVAIVSIERYKFATLTNDCPELAAVSIDHPEVDTLSKDCDKVPTVALERFEVRSMSINPHEVAEGSVNPAEVSVDVTIKSMNGSIEGSGRNVSSGSQKDTEASKDKREDNPFLMLQRSTIERWDMDALSLFLTKNNWKETAQRLRDQEIDGEALLLANKDQLMTIGINEKQAELMNDFIMNCNSVLVESD